MKTHPGPYRGPDWILDNGSDGLVEVKNASLEATRFRQDPFFWRQRRFPDFAELKKGWPGSHAINQLRFPFQQMI